MDGARETSRPAAAMKTERSSLRQLTWSPSPELLACRSRRADTAETLTRRRIKTPNAPPSKKKKAETLLQELKQERRKWTTFERRQEPSAAEGYHHHATEGELAKRRLKNREEGGGGVAVDSALPLSSPSSASPLPSSSLPPPLHPQQTAPFSCTARRSPRHHLRATLA